MSQVSIGGALERLARENFGGSCLLFFFFQAEDGIRDSFR
jgi:hypothetical protein